MYVGTNNCRRHTSPPSNTDFQEGNFRSLMRMDEEERSSSSFSFGSSWALQRGPTTSSATVIQGLLIQEDRLLNGGLANTTLLNSTVNNNTELFYARECNCFHVTVYCPFTVKSCQAARYSRGFYEPPPGCLTRPPQGEFAALVMVMIVIFFIFQALLIVKTDQGRSALHYIASIFSPDWNRHVANHMLQHDLERARRYIGSNVLRRRRMLERMVDRQNRTVLGPTTAGQDGTTIPTVVPPVAAAIVPQDIRLVDTITTPRRSVANVHRRPTSLTLRTRIYKVIGESKPEERSGGKTMCGSDYGSPSFPPLQPSSQSVQPSPPPALYPVDNGDQLLEDGNTCCTICFAPLFDGDRVGELPCDHLFHVDCLKLWLGRRNVCPLCLMPNVASPRFDDDDDVRDEESGMRTPVQE